MTTSRFCPHCGAANVPTDLLCYACQQSLQTVQKASALLNERYIVLTQIGSGGFGAVYQARDTWEQDRIVAIKQINLQGLTPQEIIEATNAFNREAQILTTLKHPLLPRIFDRFSDPEHWYLVMNFIDGSTLDEYLQQHAMNAFPKRAGLPLEETLNIGLHLCDALRYLHSQQPPVIFRDIKPGNIMRTPSGQLYLIDFGIARHFKPGQAKDTIPFGSPGFAAPEQYGRAQTTPQADIYSLGALLYCLISGDDPADHPFQFPPLHLDSLDGMRELNALIQRMVALDASQRPADIAEVRADLQAIQQVYVRANRQPIWVPPQGQTPPDPSTFRAQHTLSATSSANKNARKTSRRGVLTAALVLVGATLIGGVVTTLGNTQTPDPTFPPPDQNGFDPSDSNTATATTQTQQVQALLPTFWSPDLSSAAVVNTGHIDLYGNQGINPWDTIYSPSFDMSSTVQWSPNNTQIATFSDNSDITIWNLSDGRAAFTIVTDTTLRPVIVAWSPNGQYLATGYAEQGDSNLTTFSIYDAKYGGKQFFHQDSSALVVTSLAWTADSKYILAPFPRTSSSDSTSTWAIKVWSSQTFQPSHTIDDPNSSDLNTTSDTIAIIASAPSSNQIAFTYYNAIWLGNITDPHSIHQFATVGTIPNADDRLRLIWSPNEQFLALLAQGTLNIWNTSNGQIVANSVSSDIVAFVWAADSKSVTTADSNNAISQLTVE